MILDTGFVIDVMKGEPAALERQRLFAEEKTQYSVAAATIFELWVGIALSRKSDEEKGKVKNALSELVTVRLSGPIAQKAGEIHGSLIKQGGGIGLMDSMIAATALLANEPVLTRNAKHFSKVKGLLVESY